MATLELWLNFLCSSAGIGRTGTFIAISMIIRKIEEDLKAGHKPSISVLSTVLKIRKMREGLVQNNTQYQFIHEAVLDYLNSRHPELLKSS